MKVLFVGPSLPDASSLIHDAGIEIAGPALQGDVVAAVRRGASVIGIIDGGFEYTAPIWHKEILYALSLGVMVYGAASMGALRAAECAAFGMIGVGRIFDDYARGTIIDDSDVALLHAPAELNYKSLSLPLVNVRATLDECERIDRLARDQRISIETSAAGIFFKERTWRSIVALCPALDRAEKAYLLPLFMANTVDQKRIDALALLERMQGEEDSPAQHGKSWHLNQTFGIWLPEDVKDAE
jgi:hypothetical protein